MEFKEFPNEFSLRAQVQVLCIHADSVLKFAEEIAAEGPEHLSDDDKAIFHALADYLDRACYQADKLRKRVRRG
ncbi:MAG: hypothetical protein ACKOBC_05455 [Hyphomicrobiales bacterium]